MLRKPGFQKGLESVLRKALTIGQAIDANLSDIKTFAMMLDGGDREGPWHKVLIDSRLMARDKSVELSNKFLEPLVKAWEHMPKEVKDLRDKPANFDNLPVPGKFEENRNRSSLWMMFLNWGNEGNRQRLLDGYGWERRHVETALQQL